MPDELENTLAAPQTPPVQDRVDAPHPRPFAATVDYRLVKIHGQGGLGRVWSAIDPHLQREVAIKELLPTNGYAGPVRQRFLLEAQITGRLTHPNIVPVYQLCEDPATGHAYYVMRMLHGQSLRAELREARQTESGMSAANLRRFLSVFTSVCNAVAYANSLGVVHRDLKPENVVLGKYGEVLVIDWGLAKIAGHDDELGAIGAADEISGSLSGSETIQGAVLGTPMYMAPEQAAGQIDHIDGRTDVFGLGAILFEILTGSPPHEREPVTALIQRIATTPCRRARDVDVELPKALDAICAHATAFDPQDRYQDATELAADIELYLAGEPVRVYREPLLMRAGRWARRHRTLVTTTVALLLAGVIGLSLNSWMVGQEQRRTDVALQRAEKNLRSARDAVDYMLTEVGEKDLENVPRMESLRRDLLDRALVFYQEFAKDAPDDPELRVEVAEAYERVGDIAGLLGNLDAASDAYARCIGTLESIDPGDAAGEQLRQQRLARTLDSFGEVARKSGNLAEAESHYRLAMAAVKPINAATMGADGEYARACYNLGLLLIEQGRVDEAEQILNESIRCYENLQRDTMDNAAATLDKYRQGLARAYINLGVVLHGKGQPEACEAAYGKAIAIMRQLLSQVPQSQQYRYELAQALLNLGNLLINDKSRREVAETAYRESLSELEWLVRSFPETPIYLLHQANANNGLGGLLFNDQHFEQAEQAWRSANQQFAELMRLQPNVPEHESLAALNKNNLAHLHDTRGDFVAARELYMEAVQLQQAALVATPQHLARRIYLRHHFRGLATVCLKLELVDETIDAARRISDDDDTPAADRIRAAEFLAQALQFLPTDLSLSDDQQQPLRHELIIEIVTLIRRAIADGYSVGAGFADREEFVAVRQDSEFAALVESMENSDD